MSASSWHDIHASPTHPYHTHLPEDSLKMHVTYYIGAISNVAWVRLCCFDRHCLLNYKMPRATGDFLPVIIMVGKVLFHLHMPPCKYVHSDLTMIPDMGGFWWKYMG